MPGYGGQIAAELNDYQTRGVQLGRQNLPSSNSPTVDENEIKLEADTKRYMLTEHSAFLSTISGMQKQCMTIEHALADTQSKCDSVLSDSGLSQEVAHHLASEQHVLIAHRAHELKLQADLNGFRREHGLDHQAHYPLDPLLHLSWIFLCIAIETVVNSFFFENQNGLLGGAVVALAISVVNLVLAGVLGYFFRFKNHKDSLAAILGWVCLLFFFVVTIYLNAVFSTFRYEYQLVADPSDVHQTTTAFKSALATAVTVFYLQVPFSDILSFVLFFIGCLLSGYAFYKGYTFDDAYPGYGPRDRRHKEAIQHATDAEHAVRENIRAVLDLKRNDTMSLKNTLLAHGTQAAQLERSLANARQNLNSLLERIQGEFALVLGTYRRSNTSVRATPAPSYFSAIANLRADFPDLSAEPIRVQVLELLSSFQRLRDRYLDRLTERIQELSRHSTEILGAQLNDFFKTIVTLAQAKIAAETQTLHSLAVDRT